MVLVPGPLAHSSSTLNIDFTAGLSFNARAGIRPADCYACVPACGCWRKELNTGELLVIRGKLVELDLSETPPGVTPRGAYSSRRCEGRRLHSLNE